jgi:hypothetical protein
MAESDFFEIDMLAVETAKSGDAICIRYKIGGIKTVHVVDGGYTETGKKILDHINQYYDNPDFIDHVVLTHSDGDHARGLKYVLENSVVHNLWMNRPWLYADELIGRFPTYNSVDALRSRLKKCYPRLVELEDIAASRRIPIREAFQGSQIGLFNVMSPSRAFYLDLIVESEKTPEGIDEIDKTPDQIIKEVLSAALQKFRNLVKSAWAHEIFSPNETSAENEMSVIQYSNILGQKILLTGDAGRRALKSFIDFAPTVGLQLPGIDRFQVPHHGSRRNVSTELLDQILGPRFERQDEAPDRAFTALISSAKADEDHPRPAVERAMRHRGGFIAATEGEDIRSSFQAPPRPGWSALTPRPYPVEQDGT